MMKLPFLTIAFVFLFFPHSPIQARSNNIVEDTLIKTPLELITPLVRTSNGGFVFNASANNYIAKGGIYAFDPLGKAVVESMQEAQFISQPPVAFPGGHISLTQTKTQHAIFYNNDGSVRAKVALTTAPVTTTRSMVVTPQGEVVFFVYDYSDNSSSLAYYDLQGGFLRKTTVTTEKAYYTPIHVLANGRIALHWRTEENGTRTNLLTLVDTSGKVLWTRDIKSGSYCHFVGEYRTRIISECYSDPTTPVFSQEGEMLKSLPVRDVTNIVTDKKDGSLIAATVWGSLYRFDENGKLIAAANVGNLMFTSPNAIFIDGGNISVCAMKHNTVNQTRQYNYVTLSSAFKELGRYELLVTPNSGWFPRFYFSETAPLSLAVESPLGSTLVMLDKEAKLLYRSPLHKDSSFLTPINYDEQTVLVPSSGVRSATASVFRFRKR